MTVNLIKTTDTCCLCGVDCAPPASLDIDPLCTACKHDLDADSIFAPMINLTELATAIALRDLIELIN